MERPGADLGGAGQPIAVPVVRRLGDVPPVNRQGKVFGLPTSEADHVHPRLRGFGVGLTQNECPTRAYPAALRLRKWRVVIRLAARRVALPQPRPTAWVADIRIRQRGPSGRVTRVARPFRPRLLRPAYPGRWPGLRERGPLARRGGCVAALAALAALGSKTSVSRSETQRPPKAANWRPLAAFGDLRSATSRASRSSAWCRSHRRGCP